MLFLNLLKCESLQKMNAELAYANLERSLMKLNFCNCVKFCGDDGILGINLRYSDFVALIDGCFMNE